MDTKNKNKHEIKFLIDNRYYAFVSMIQNGDLSLMSKRLNWILGLQEFCFGHMYLSLIS